MFTRIWSTRHGARQIRLEYDWSLTSFKRRARLLTDGKRDRELERICHGRPERGAVRRSP